MTKDAEVVKEEVKGIEKIVTESDDILTNLGFEQEEDMKYLAELKAINPETTLKEMDCRIQVDLKNIDEDGLGEITAEFKDKTILEGEVAINHFDVLQVYSATVKGLKEPSKSLATDSIDDKLLKKRILGKRMGLINSKKNLERGIDAMLTNIREKEEIVVSEKVKVKGLDSKINFIDELLDVNK